MPCDNCGHQRVGVVATVKDGEVKTTVKEEIDPMAMVYVLYTGNRTGAFTVFGKATKRAYRVTKYKPLFPVDEQDAPSIVNGVDFVLRAPTQPEKVKGKTRSGPKEVLEAMEEAFPLQSQGRQQEWRRDRPARPTSTAAAEAPKRILRQVDEKGTSKVTLNI